MTRMRTVAVIVGGVAGVAFGLLTGRTVTAIGLGSIVAFGAYAMMLMVSKDT